MSEDHEAYPGEREQLRGYLKLIRDHFAVAEGEQPLLCQQIDRALADGRPGVIRAMFQEITKGSIPNDPGALKWTRVPVQETGDEQEPPEHRRITPSA